MISPLFAYQIISLFFTVAIATNNNTFSSTRSRKLAGNLFKSQYVPPLPSYATGECGDKDVMHVNFGYYQSWAQWREEDCNPVPVDSLNASVYTHLAYSFAWINEKYELEAYNGNIREEELSYKKFMSLKQQNPFLKLLITVGGWTFSDPGPTFRRFSEAVEDANRPTFVNSILAFCEKYGFEGIDLDWEFPGDYGRGGKPEDKKGYADLAEDLRKEFDKAGHKDWDISIAIPLHQRLVDYGYDLGRLAESVDFLNLMAYNLHGNWEEEANAHTNLTDIMNYLVYFLEDWKFPPEKLLLGLAPYGRTYLMEDKDCLTYNCPFKASGPGGCLDNANFMTYFSIQQRIEAKDYTSYTPFNTETATAEMVIDGNVLIDFDSTLSMAYKAHFAREACFGGIMWWAVDMMREPIILAEIERNFPTYEPTNSPTKEPTGVPSIVPTLSPSATLSTPPTSFPSSTGSSVPTLVPTAGPTIAPSKSAGPTTGTMSPTMIVSTAPTLLISAAPSDTPTSLPTDVQTVIMSSTPTLTENVVPSQDLNRSISGPSNGVPDGITSPAETCHCYLPHIFLTTW
eukprot:CAMPEP_0194146264 /NCGR_PEP_ID=MMETSP0152-20130528/20483_1 /TAXON_ID=1049557 /ORGANISM="Thalassiothrix antarctica, Strain L6-D1" /LENGTH=569 /DNA_ID=CAMNT_0038846747 /DNA_START=41 /DNA_END=1747 /DNA_ORIENTATION=-